MLSRRWEAQRASLIGAGASFDPAHGPPPSDLSQAVLAICMQLPPRRAARAVPHVVGYLNEADLRKLLQWVSDGWRGRPPPLHLSPVHTNRARVNLSVQSAQYAMPFLLTPAADNVDVEARTIAVPDAPLEADVPLAERFNAGRRQLRAQIRTGERDDTVDRKESAKLIQRHRKMRADAPLLRLLVLFFLSAPKMRGVHRREVVADLIALADTAFAGEAIRPRWRTRGAPVPSVHVARWVWEILDATGAGALTSAVPLDRAWTSVAAHVGGEAALPARDLAALDAVTAKLHVALPDLQATWSRRLARDAVARSGHRLLWTMVGAAGWRLVPALAVHALRRFVSRGGGTLAMVRDGRNRAPWPADAVAVLARHGLVAAAPHGPWWLVDAQAVAGARINAVMGWGAVALVLSAAAAAAWAVLVQ